MSETQAGFGAGKEPETPDIPNADLDKTEASETIESDKDIAVAVEGTDSDSEVQTSVDAETDKKTRRSALKDPELAQKSLVLASRTPIWIDVVASIGVIGVLIANSADWSVWFRIFFVLLLILGLIGQTRFASSVAIRSDWFVGVGVVGAILGFAVGIAVVPWVLWYSLSVWWTLAVFVIFTVIATFIFRGLRWLALTWAEKRELNKQALAEDEEEVSEADEADAQEVDSFTTEKVEEIEAEDEKAEELAEQLENLDSAKDLPDEAAINPLIGPQDGAEEFSEESAEAETSDSEPEPNPEEHKPTEQY